MRIFLELDDYEVINLLQALKFIPNNGEWLANIKEKIKLEITKNYDGDYNKFESDVMPNSGIDVLSMKKHIDFILYKERNS